MTETHPIIKADLTEDLFKRVLAQLERLEKSEDKRPSLLKSLFTSKKFVTALIAFIGGIAMKLGLPVSTVAELGILLSPLLVYIGAQGVADLGKHAARIKAGSER